MWRLVFSLLLLLLLPLNALSFTLPDYLEFDPILKSCYCKETCSPRTRIFRNVTKHLYCYHPTKIPYGAYKYSRLAKRVALHYGLNPYVFMAQIECESLWKPDVVSPDGGYGLCQVTPRVLGERVEVGKLFDPSYNLRVGARIKSKSKTRARKLLKSVGCEDADPEVISLRIYNGGSRFLRKELAQLVEWGLWCSFDWQLESCCRDLCLWKVNTAYVVRVLKAARKYKEALP